MSRLLDQSRTHCRTGTSSATAKTACTGSPMAMVAGSISFGGPAHLLDEIADEPDVGILDQLDGDDVVGSELGEAGEQRRVRHDPRPDVSAAGHRLPVPLEGTARGTHRPGRVTEASARGALLHAEDPVPGGVEEAGGLLRARQQHGRGVGEIDDAHPLSSSALVGTPSPLVTNENSASSTWQVDVPRTWRTPSRMRLKPWT